MNSKEIVARLERERRLLKQFRRVSEDQLKLLEGENLRKVQRLLERRQDLMMELAAIEATLGTWIIQIRADPSIRSETIRDLLSLSDEIVELATEVVWIDEETHRRLAIIGRSTPEARRRGRPSP